MKPGVHRSPRRKGLIILPILLLAGLYVAAYAYARQRHWIVHRSGFSQGATATHTMAPGDFGTGLNPEHRLASWAYSFFAPLCVVEEWYWHIRHPVGSPWPYENAPPPVVTPS